LSCVIVEFPYRRFPGSIPRAARQYSRASNYLLLPKSGDIRDGVSELGQNLIGVLAQ
jgi:hypothetical protein